MGSRNATVVSKYKVTTETVAITALSRDPQYQVRKNLDEATVKQYIAVYTSGKKMPPVQVAVIEGVPVLVDGWHRVAALERMGRDAVEAEVRPMTRKEALWAAAKANTEHGKPLKATELREVYKVYMRTKQHKNPDGSLKSYREIGMELGRGHTTIRNWEFKHFPATARARGGEPPSTHYEPVQPERSPEALKKAEAALVELKEAFGQSSDPEVRGDIVERVTLLLKALKDAGNWAEPMF